MKLYYIPGTCSLAIHIIGRELGIEFQLVRFHPAKRATQDGTDYDAINSKGMVPVLELDDGQRLTEGPVIAQYLADRHGATSLMPAARSMARYRVMEWQNFITSELHKAFGPLFDSPRLGGEGKARYVELLSAKFRWVDAQLEGRSYLTGSDFTAADAYLFTVSGWARLVGLDLSGLANLQAYLGRVMARPAVLQAMRAEGLIPQA